MRNRLMGALVAGLVAVTMSAVAAPAANAQPGAGFAFTAEENSVRVLDTRASAGQPVWARSSVTIDLGAQVPAGTTAVVLNVTGLSLTEPTYVTAWQAGEPRPGVASLNLRVRETRANMVTVPVGSDRRVSLYNHNGNTHLIADLVGHYGPAGTSWYNSVTPQRFLDTRSGEPFHGQSQRTVSLAGLVPPGTTSVVVNATAVNPPRETYLSLTRSIDGPRPATSSVNAPAGEVTPNLVTVPLNDELKFAVYNNAGDVNVLFDLIGYYTPAAGAAFHPITPTRAYDSRTTGWVPPGSQRRVPLGGAVPAEAETVLFNLTGLGYYYGTHLTTWPTGQPRPNTSTLNLTYQQAASNHAVVDLGTGRAVDVYNHTDHTHVIVDVSGYFAPRAN